MSSPLFASPVDQCGEPVQFLVGQPRRRKVKQRGNCLLDRALEKGKPAYLIDDESELAPEWFNGIQAVLITAGASAPEHLVQELMQFLKDASFHQMEEIELVDEDVRFSLPAELTITIQ